MINGVINVYKEPGYTSHDVVAKLRGILKQKKIGHMGTLDPNAVGVLPVCLGKATKLCNLLSEKDKTYTATMLLGTETDTQDTTGQITNQTPEEEVMKLSEELDVKLIPYECADELLSGTEETPMERTRNRLKTILPGQSIGIMIGPEGGLEKAEVEQSMEAGFTPVTLGKRILRTETAGLCILSVLMFQLEE